MKRTVLYLSLVLASGCSWIGLEDEPPPPPTLGDLKPVYLEGEAEPLTARTLAERELAYRQALAVAEQPAVRLEVRQRLADIALQTGEAGSDDYSAAIADYEALVAEYAQQEGGDQLLYQLARAYDLAGRGDEALVLMRRLSDEYPQSEHFAEAEFRKGEAAFSEGNYAAAQASYERVLVREEQTEYAVNALYMSGWTQFKRGRFNDAVNAFAGALDRLVRSDGRMENMPRGEREMADDCLRVLAMIFNEQGGSEAIARFEQDHQPRGYNHLLYASLSALYLEQERYRDSAETLHTYIAEHPESPQAHQYHLDAIAAWEQGGFPAEVIEQKRAYVAAYPVAGPYWRMVGPSQRDRIRPALQQYIEELARHHHALAQEENAEAPEVQYGEAARYYALYIDSFPRDERLPDLGFLLAETRFAAGDYRTAVSDYEWVAYRYPDHPQAAEAGYAAVLAHRELGSELDEDQLAWIDSELKFAHSFPEDSRAPPVLAHAAAQLLDQGLYQRAVLAAGDLIDWQPPLDNTLLTDAWLITADAEYALSRHAQAQVAYQEALTRLPADDERRSHTEEQLAASVYRQGEMAAAAGRHMQAAEHFAQVLVLAPTSQVRMNAQYDAASSYIKARDFDAANALLEDFRERYPEHELSATVGPLLVENYEANRDWARAAAELDRIAAASDDPDVVREAQYVAAGYYADAGDTEMAIERFRAYAHRWYEPVAIRMEAMNTLADIYADTDETEKRYYWLRAMAEAHDDAGDAQSERSLYLAAHSVSELADAYYDTYTAINLTVPLRENLRRKRAAMEPAVAAYERTAAYGLQPLGTRATYQLGTIYSDLSEALIQSERPADMDALALEQYELLLEEQAWPFEEKATEIHETNARRSWNGLYDVWVRRSFAALRELLPARYAKVELSGQLSEEIQ